MLTSTDNQSQYVSHLNSNQNEGHLINTPHTDTTNGWVLSTIIAATTINSRCFHTSKLYTHLRARLFSSQRIVMRHNAKGVLLRVLPTVAQCNPFARGVCNTTVAIW